jgi:butyrate kinase
MGAVQAYRILVINPGSTSTKLALFENTEPLWSEMIVYSVEQLSAFHKTIDQLHFRQTDVERTLQNRKTIITSLKAVSARGGPFKPLQGGTYLVDEAVLSDVRSGNVIADHASNLGVLLAYAVAHQAGVPAFFVDPVSVDEFEPVARISGMPELERKSLLHTLNIKATARGLAKDLGKTFLDMNLVVAHLGGGISICAVRRGKILDVNNAYEGGPFSPERAGSLPTSSLVNLCYSGRFTHQEMRRKIVGNAGLSAHLGTHDAREITKRIESGDEKADLIFQSMAYQIAKEIGAMATVLCGRVDAILLTGGLAHCRMLMDWIKKRVSFLAPTYVYPGEREMEALALGALRVLRGEEKTKTY